MNDLRMTARATSGITASPMQEYEILCRTREDRRRLVKDAQPSIQADITQHGSKQLIAENGHSILIIHSPAGKLSPTIANSTTTKLASLFLPTYADAYIKFDGEVDYTLAAHLYIDYWMDWEMRYCWWFEVRRADGVCANHERYGSFEEVKAEMLTMIRSWAQVEALSKQG